MISRRSILGAMAASVPVSAAAQTMLFTCPGGLSIDASSAGIPASVQDPVFTNLTGKIPMSAALVPGQKTFSCLALGQSFTSNNVMDAVTPYNAGTSVSNLGTDGLLYQAVGPLLGAGGSFVDNPLSRYGALIKSNNKASRINICNRGIGSTNPQNFNNTGNFSGVIPLLASNLRTANLQLDAIDLEWGNSAALGGMSAQTYSDGIRSVVARLRQYGLLAPVFVIKNTIFTGTTQATQDAVRAGVDLSLSAALGIFLGADMDTIALNQRAAGPGHWLMTGAQSSAQLRYNNHAAFFGW